MKLLSDRSAPLKNLGANASADLVRALEKDRSPDDTGRTVRDVFDLKLRIALGQETTPHGAWGQERPPRGEIAMKIIATRAVGDCIIGCAQTRFASSDKRLKNLKINCWFGFAMGVVLAGFNARNSWVAAIVILVIAAACAGGAGYGFLQRYKQQDLRIQNEQPDLEDIARSEMRKLDLSVATVVVVLRKGSNEDLTASLPLVIERERSLKRTSLVFTVGPNEFASAKAALGKGRKVYPDIYTFIAS